MCEFSEGKPHMDNNGRHGQSLKSLTEFITIYFVHFGLIAQMNTLLRETRPNN